MSIATKLEKLTTDITSAYTSIENKGGTIPSDKNTDNLHTAIDSIEVIEQATAEGESISLANTKAMPYKDYVVEGKSEQTTRSGKNLWNDNDMLLGYWAYADGTYLRTNTWICTPKIACKGNVDYTFQFANNSRWYGFVWYDENNNFISTANQQNNLQTGFRSFTAKSPSNAGYLAINIAGYPGTNDTIRTDDLINFQLEESSTATDYEPYGASPSPDYPSEIHSVADDVNLFDLSKIANSSISVTDNGKTIIMPVSTSGNGNTNTATKLNVLCPDLQVGDVIYIRFKRNLNNNRNHFIYLYSSNKIMYAMENSPSYTITQDDLNSYVFLYGNDYDYGETEQCIITDFKIQKNTIPINCSPYNQGTVTIKQRGKNKFDYKQIMSNASRTIENGGFVINDTDFQHGSLIGILKNLCPELKVGDKFKFNWDTNATRNNSDVNYIYLNLYANTIRKDITYICTQEMLDSETYFYGQQGEYYKDIIFYLDGQTSDYEPYQANDYTFQTKPLCSLPNGVKDTIEEDGIHRRVGRHILPEIATLSSGTAFGTQCQYAFYSLSNSKTGGRNYNFISNIIAPANEIYGQYKGYKNSTDIVVMTSTDDTLENFNSKISGSEVLYELAEEIIEPLTQNQATTMLDIIKTGSYEGTTNIYTDEDVKPTMEVDYYKKK